MSFPPLVNMADLGLSCLSRPQARGGVSAITLSTIGRKETWGPEEDTVALKACSRCFSLASRNLVFLGYSRWYFWTDRGPRAGHYGTMMAAFKQWNLPF